MLVLLFSPLIAVEYMTVEEALEKAFAKSAHTQVKPALNQDQAQLVISKAGSKARGKFDAIYLAHHAGQVDGVTFIDNAIGRTEFFTYACSLNADGTVKRIDVLVYREPKGMEIKQRAWLQRFEGKKYGDTLRVKRDIPNISGASLSCKAMVERVRFMVTYYDLVLKAQLVDELEKLPKAAARSQPAYQVEQSAIISEPLLRISFPEQDKSDEELKQIALAVFALANEWDARINTWKPDSELSTLLRQNSGKVSNELRAFLKAVDRSVQQNAGVVDPSIEPLLQVWRTAKKQQKIPDEATIKTALAQRLWRQIRWDDNDIVFPEGLQLNVSAFAKGWIVDRLVEYLKQQDVQALINFGESSFAAVAMQAPIQIRAAQDAPAQSLLLQAGQCLACSGSDRSAITIGEQRYSHFIDPTTGLLIQGARYATVIADSAFKADALATVGCILPSKQALSQLKAAEVHAASLSHDGVKSVYGAWPDTTAVNETNK